MSVPLFFPSLRRINDFKFTAPETLLPAAGANAKLRYQITSGNKGGVFDIEPEVGTIFVAQPLDYEQQKRFKLLVLASDGKWEDYAAVVVTVVNKNDEAPVFSMNEYYGSVTEELDGSPVFVLQVNADAASSLLVFDFKVLFKRKRFSNGQSGSCVCVCVWGSMLKPAGLRVRMQESCLSRIH